MLDFEKELENFEPSMEIEEVMEIIDKKDISDIVDVIKEIMKNQ